MDGAVARFSQRLKEASSAQDFGLPEPKEYKEICRHFRELAKEFGDLADGSDDKPVDVEHLTQVDKELQSALFKLRLVNREATMRKVAARTELEQKRRVLDEAVFALRAAKAEQQHLRHEIVKCQKIRTVFQTIPLASEDVFDETAPEHFKPPRDGDESVPEAEHKKMLNRFAFEKEERMRLEKDVEARKTRKRELEEIIARKRARLSRIDSEMRARFSHVKSLRSIMEGDSS